MKCQAMSTRWIWRTSQWPVGRAPWERPAARCTWPWSQSLPRHATRSTRWLQRASFLGAAWWRVKRRRRTKCQRSRRFQLGNLVNWWCWFMMELFASACLGWEGPFFAPRPCQEEKPEKKQLAPGSVLGLSGQPDLAVATSLMDLTTI